MIKHRFPVAATLIILAGCQSDRENTAQSSTSAAAPGNSAHSVPAAPIAPDLSGFKLDNVTLHVTSGPPGAAPTPPEPDTSPAGRLATVKQDYEDAISAYSALFKDAKTKEEREVISKDAKRPDVDTYRARARAIVDEDPAAPVALDAITWMLTNARGGTDQAELLAIVEKNHMQSDKLVGLARGLSNDTKNGGQEFVQMLVEKSTNANVRGTALYSLASEMQRDIDSAKSIQSAKEEDADKMSKRYGARLETLKALDVTAQQKQVDAMLERTVKDFPDVAYGKTTLGERAGADLFERNNLVVGKLAPDIEGEDLDGAKFHLADYRGKIVLLDFWGNW